MLKDIILVGLGGSIGSIFRYLSSLFVNKYYSGVFPLATFLVNIVGCLIIGLLIGLGERNGIIGKDLKMLLITGFCGGFTTFSTFSSENVHLIETSNFLILFLYIALSLMIGISGVWLGTLISKI